MIGKKDMVKLIAFFGVTAAVILGIVGLFLGFTFWREVDVYTVNVPNSVEGVQEGTPVQVRGVRVGTVSAVDLVWERYTGARLTLEIEEGTVIKEDDHAYLEMKGLTGQRIIDIKDGTASAPIRNPGTSIPFGRTLLDQLQDEAQVLVENVSDLLADLKRVTGRIDGWTLELEEAGVERLVVDARNAVSEFEGAGRELGALIQETRPPLRHVLDQVDQTLSVVKSSSRKVDTSLSTFQHAARDLHQLIQANEARLTATLREIRAASREFHELGRRLRERPSALIFSDAPEERELP